MLKKLDTKKLEAPPALKKLDDAPASKLKEAPALKKLEEPPALKKLEEPPALLKEGLVKRNLKEEEEPAGPAIAKKS